MKPVRDFVGLLLFCILLFSNDCNNSEARDTRGKSKQDAMLENLEYNIRSKFQGSTKAQLLSLKIVNNNLVIGARHSDCSSFKSLFVDIGVACYRYGKIGELKFNKAVLELHCQNNLIKRYYILKSGLMKYVNLSINDVQFMSLIRKLGR